MTNFFTEEIRHSLTLFSENSGKYSEFLDQIGKICGEKIASNAAEVDKIGVKLEGNSVVLSQETIENIENLRSCGYLGSVLPEFYGGKSLPKLFDVAAIEMISRADASLMTLVSLQEIGRLIYLYGSEEQKKRILPGIAGGKLTCAVVLTESHAGSDLQAVGTKAREENGFWYLSGTKHFVTNGGADIMLVLARSEEGVSGGRGLSLFIREKNADNNCNILKTFDKLGICGSPTCTVRFENAKCELLGKRRYGLVKYAAEILLSARIGVAAQALGIAAAALSEAGKYAACRMQFGKKIEEIPQVEAMLRKMRESVGGIRLLLYFTASEFDAMEALSLGPQSTETAAGLREIRSEVEFLVPLVKFFAAETANRVACDALQIHGGNGYLRGVAVERLARDARVTSIYEGTSQIQASAVASKISNGALLDFVKKLVPEENFSEIAGKLNFYAGKLTETASSHREDGKLEFCAELFAESAAFVVLLALSLRFNEDFSNARKAARFFAAIDFFITRIELT
ncbi:acyl-CoA dehydrogenase family protein [bacterium]|nr:acyl-CoA dehydrogenase family protein [bacterium]